MKKMTLWNYVFIAVIVSYVLLYFLVDNLEIRLIAISASLGFVLNLLRDKIGKTSWYVLAICVSIFSFGVLIYILTMNI